MFETSFPLHLNAGEFNKIRCFKRAANRKAPFLPVSVQHDGLPTRNEIVAAIRHQKNCKFPGEDGITAERLKAGHDLCVKSLLDIFTDIWYNGEVQNDWQSYTIAPLYKRGCRMTYNNFIGILLLSLSGKALARVIVNWVWYSIEAFMSESSADSERTEVPLIKYLQYSSW